MMSLFLIFLFSPHGEEDLGPLFLQINLYLVAVYDTPSQLKSQCCYFLLES